MSYFSLRKRDPETEPEEVEDDLDEAEEEPEETPKKAAPKQPGTWPEAIWYGICGPGRWLAGHLGEAGVTTAWIAYVGSTWATSYYGGWTAIGITAVWLFFVLAFIPREFLDRAAEAIERLFSTAPKPSPAVAPGGEREAVRRLLLDLIGDAHGVHLKTVLAHLQQHGHWEGKKVADLRVHLEALGIPVDPKLRVGKVPTRGVLRTALEALPPVEETSPSRTPSPPV